MIKFLIILMLIPSLCFGAASRSYDGTNDKVSHGTDSSLNLTNTDSSLSFWVKPGSNALNFERIAIKRVDVDNWGMCGYQFNAAEFWFSYREGASQVDMSLGLNTYAIGVWYYVNFQFDTDTGTPGTGTIYVNLNNETLASESGVGGGTADGFLTGLRSDDGGDFSGQIAYIKKYSVELNAVERAELMWKPEMIPGAKLFAPYWGDSVEIDLSGNGFTGTPSGATTSSDGPPVMLGGGLPL